MWCALLELACALAPGSSIVMGPSSLPPAVTGTGSSQSRRAVLAAAAALAASSVAPSPILAAPPKTVAVAGATGQTGRRVLERLAAQPGLTVIGGVRDVAKANKALSSSSTVVRGAMLEKVGAVDASKVDLRVLDVEKNSVAQIAETLKGAEALVIATGFVPGNPFKMDAAAHAVDNLGTVALIDGAKAAGVGKVVLITSILTDGPAWGQVNSPGYQVTNAFGHVLEEKLVAEKYLRASGLDWTIVRPGGLKADPPQGGLFVSGENTLNSGEISRDLVADVCVAAISDAQVRAPCDMAPRCVQERRDEAETSPRLIRACIRRAVEEQGRRDRRD